MKRFLIIAVSTLLVVGLALYFLHISTPVTNIPGGGGEIDVSSVNLDSTVALLPLDWEYYPDGLFTPEDIASGAAGVPRLFNGKAN
jgi:hypothetical protein